MRRIQYPEDDSEGMSRERMEHAGRRAAYPLEAGEIGAAGREMREHDVEIHGRHGQAEDDDQGARREALRAPAVDSAEARHDQADLLLAEDCEERDGGERPEPVLVQEPNCEQ